MDDSSLDQQDYAYVLVLQCMYVTGDKTLILYCFHLFQMSSVQRERRVKNLLTP